MPLWWRPLPAGRSSQGPQLGHTLAPLLLQISSSGGWGDGEGAALAVVGAEGRGQDLSPPMGGGGWDREPGRGGSYRTPTKQALSGIYSVIVLSQRPCRRLLSSLVSDDKTGLEWKGPCRTQIQSGWAGVRAK